MGDNPESTKQNEASVASTPEETKIEIGEVFLMPYRQPPPSYNQSQQPYPPQVYYYPDSSYDQRNTPVYQQRYGGGPYGGSYYGSYPPEPPNAARGPMIRQPESNHGFRFFGSGEIFTDAFDSVKIRNRFVQRVYTILSVQLLFSFLFVLLAAFEDNTRLLLRQFGLPLMIIAMIVFMTVFCAVICTQARHQYPLNFILLGVLTIAMTILVMCLTAWVPPMIVLLAMGTTAALCFMVSIFACQTRWDVTGCGMCLCIATAMLALYGLIIMILMLCGIHLKLLHVIYSALATLIFTFWLMYDTQMIVGGRRLELSPEEYIVGALELYIDIMYIFIHLLELYQYCMGGE